MLNHLGIIMDGNRTWAEEKNLPKVFGHKVGAENVERIVFSCLEKNIKYVTLWGLSTDNLDKREKSEVKDIIKIINGAKKYLKNIMKNGGKIQLIGDIQRLPKESQNTLYNLVEETKNNKKITITLALAYGGQDEIIRGIKEIINLGVNVNDLSRDEFRKYLDIGKLPIVDMIVRTGGHNRLSGFLLYDSEYVESCFLDVNWPDFDKKHLEFVINQYNQSQRKFGK